MISREGPKQTMQCEITYEWSPELVCLGTRRFILRYAGRSLVASAVIMVLAIAALIIGRAESFWWIIIILPVIYALIWFGHYRKAVRVCKEMPDRGVTVRIDPEGITFQTSQHTTTMKWSLIRRLWSYPDVLLLFTYTQQTYTILPSAVLGDDTRRFIEEKVREHGGQVA